MALPTRSGNVLAMLLGLLLGLGSLACQSDEEKLVSFMSRGDEYREAEQYKEAIIEYRNVLQIDPNHLAAHRALADAYLQNKDFREGYWELSETVRLNPTDMEARLTYAGVSLLAKRFDEVLTQAEAMIELDPNHAAAHLLRGQALLGLEREDEVEASFLRAVELNPDEAGFRVALAFYYETVDRYDDAEKLLREAIERGPDAAGPWTALARLMAANPSRDVETEAAFRKAIDLSADQLTEEVGKPSLSSAYGALAGFFFRRERFDEGVATVEEAITKMESEKRKLEFINILARVYGTRGDDAMAEAMLERATQVSKNDPAPYLAISAARGRKGDIKGALEAAESAVAIDPTHIPSRLRKAELLVDIGYREQNEQQAADGRQIVEQVLEERPNSPEALFVRAKIELAAGDHLAAIESLRVAIDGRPDWGRAHFVLGSALTLAGEKQRARAELARAVELEPALLDARRLLTRVHAELGEHEYSIDQGTIYLRSKPDDDELRILVAQGFVRLGKIDEAAKMLAEIPEERRGIEALFAIGRIQLVQGDVEGASASLLKANEERPNNAKVLSSLLSLDRAAGKLSHSIKRINDAVEAEPEEGALRRLKGMVAVLTNDLPLAEESFKKAIELEPDSLQAYAQLGGLYRMMGRMEETVAIYEQVVETRPESAPPHHFLAVLYEMSGKVEQAREQYELALRYDSTLSESKNNLAYLLAESGQDLDRALKLAQEAKAAMPDSPNAADTLGWVLLKRGVASAAIGYLREAVQVSDPSDPAIGVIRTHLSDAYAAAGDLEKAIETLETALADFDKKKKAAGAAQDPPWAAEARAKVEQLKGELGGTTG